MAWEYQLKIPKQGTLKMSFSEWNYNKRNSWFLFPQIWWSCLSLLSLLPLPPPYLSSTMIYQYKHRKMDPKDPLLSTSTLVQAATASFTLTSYNPFPLSVRRSSFTLDSFAHLLPRTTSIEAPPWPHSGWPTILHHQPYPPQFCSLSFTWL